MDREGRLRERAAGADGVLDDDGLLALHVADDVHDLADVRRRAALVDDREARTEPLRERAGALDAAGIRRDDDRALAAEPEDAKLLDQDRHRIEVIERDVEEALDLTGVEIERAGAIRARRGDEVRDELRADRRARL